MPTAFAAIIVDCDDYTPGCLGIATTHEGALAILAEYAREVHAQTNSADLPLPDDDQAAVDYFFADDAPQCGYVDQFSIPVATLNQLAAQGG